MRDLTPDIENISDIVAFPAVITELQSEIVKDNVASVRIAQLVKMDAALTMQVLRAVNSSYYGLRYEVSSVTQATAILGFEEVTHLALTFYMRQQILKLNEHQKEFLDLLWRHSLSTAVVGQSLAAKLELRPIGKAFTAGLLHDIGKIVLAQYYPDYLDEIRRMTAEDGIADIDAEHHLVGITHSEIGAQLCRKWMLPQELIDIIHNHHALTDSTRPEALTPVIRFADLVCESLDLGIGEQPLPIDLAQDPSWKILQVQHQFMRTITFDKLFADLKNDLDQRKNMFDLV